MGEKFLIYLGCIDVGGSYTRVGSRRRCEGYVR